MNQSATAPTPVVFSADLRGIQIIEASAGTGKTWTIAGLFLRLLLEKEARIEDILAVTFTKAATAELKDRIRERIRELVDVLEGRRDEDDHHQELLIRCPDRKVALLRLIAALRGFDDSAIFTIHGYCQRALTDFAFSSGSEFNTELVTDTRDLMHEVAADYWRIHVAPAKGAGPAEQVILTRWLMDTAGDNVETLGKWIRDYAGKEDLKFIGPSPIPPVDTALACFLDAHAKAKTLWLAQRNALEKLLLEHKPMNRSKYAARHIPNWCRFLDEYFGDEPSHLELPGQLERFGYEKLNDASQDPPTHDFFTLAEALMRAADDANNALALYWSQLRINFIAYLNTEIRKRLAQQRAQSFNTLISRLHEALHHPDGEVLAHALRTRYPHALIDEFQDTDPQQWGIVKKIYGPAPAEKHATFLVGDPKQAIYSFRGADVYAYMSAVASVGTPLTLSENQRSVPTLVTAMNVLFKSRENPFFNEQIRYAQVRPSPREKDALVEDGHIDQAPLRLAWLGPKSDGKLQNKEAGRDWATGWVVAEIVRLLDGATKGAVRLGKRELRAGDIAVLVNTHKQGSAIRNALSLRGISSAQLSNDSVFKSVEAEQLERLLIAVAHPGDVGSVRAALATDFIGWSAHDIATLDDENRWDTVFTQFVGFQTLWAAHGVMRMVRELTRSFDTPRMLGQFADGERRLTNLNHLTEVLHIESESLHGPESLLTWLRSRRSEEATEASQLRLESDEKLVQIVTIHKCKGLEYPVTFVPFLWDATSFVMKKDIVAFHDKSPPHAVTVDWGSPNFDTSQQAAVSEELGERLRLAYVALTRAKNRCYVLTGAASGISCSSLGWLLHGLNQSDGQQAPDKNTLVVLAEKSGGTITIVDPDDQAAASTLTSGATLSDFVARDLRKPVPYGYSLTSFSRLQASESLEDPDPLPDHDQRAVPIVIPNERFEKGGGRFAFVRGKDAGNVLHNALENIDWADRSQWKGTLADLLVENFYNPAWAEDLEIWLSEVVNTPMPDPSGGPAFKLSDIPKARLLREMGFHLRVTDFDVTRIATITKRHGIPMSLFASRRISGYLSGCIDLAFQMHGRWYVADYKSTWLGSDPAGYDRAGISAVMADDDYHLQYLIYTLALHRWLKARMPDYDYDKHWGGTLYLFLRGVKPEWTTAASPTGVYATRPSRELIEQLDRAFGTFMAVPA